MQHPEHTSYVGPGSAQLKSPPGNFSHLQAEAPDRQRRRTRSAVCRHGCRRRLTGNVNHREPDVRVTQRPKPADCNPRWSDNLIDDSYVLKPRCDEPVRSPATDRTVRSLSRSKTGVRAGAAGALTSSRRHPPPGIRARRRVQVAGAQGGLRRPAKPRRPCDVFAVDTARRRDSARTCSVATTAPTSCPGDNLPARAHMSPDLKRRGKG
jgi:hypothetical protein